MLPKMFVPTQNGGENVRTPPPPQAQLILHPTQHKKCPLPKPMGHSTSAISCGMSEERTNK